MMEAEIIASRKKTQKENAPAQEFVPQYDLASTQRYVDSTSRKTEFDRVLDELKNIAAEKLSWDVLRMTQKHFGETKEDNERKLEAFLGSLILGAATELFDRGMEDVAFRQLEQAKTVLDARRKLSREVESIRSRTQEESFDVSDLLGLFDDGQEE